jgi:hypothetical protein
VVITATHEREEARVTIEVVQGTVRGLQVIPDQAEIVEDEQLQLQVIAHMSTGEALDVTLGSTGTLYESSDEALATVSADGLVMAHAEGGPVYINCRNFGRTAVARITVLHRYVTPDSVRVNPSRVTLEPGAELQLTVTAIYPGGVEANVTASAAGTT